MSDLLETAVGKKVLAIVARKFNISEALSADANFIEDLGADSIDVVELIMELEEEFKLEIPAEQSEKILTIADAIVYLNEHA